MTLFGELFERLTILTKLRAHLISSNYPEAAEACTPSIVLLNEEIERVMSYLTE